MEWWSALSVDQRLTVAVAFGSAILGGGISLATSWLLTKLNNKHSLETRKQENRERKAADAQRAFVKTVQFANSIYSLDRAISGQFEDAAEAGHAHLLPVQKVQEISGLDSDFDNYHSEELTFLLHSKDAELLGDLLIFEKRAMSLNDAVKHYNEKRAELTSLLEAGAISADTKEGAVLTSELKGRDALMVDVRVSALQGLLGTIVERADRDTKEARELLGRLNEVAKEEFGELFPNLKIEDPN